MEHRSLTLDFEKGEIKGIWLKAELDETYRLLFRNASQTAKRYPRNVAHGIKIIIFGSFWIEVYANEIMRLIFELEIDSKPLKKAIWDRLKKSSIQEKLEILSKVSPNKIKQDYQTIKQPIKDLFDLRNRLAHFKDEPESIDLSANIENTNENETGITIERFKSMMEKCVPVPDINQRLMWQHTRKAAGTVSKTIDWLTKIKDHSNKKHQIKSEIIKLNKLQQAAPPDRR
jgi:methyl-accepting chemotaxis protein